MPIPAQSSQSERDRLAGRLALAGSVCQFSGYISGPLIIPHVQYRQGGQPYLPQYPSLHCSISHSYGRGLGAVSLGPIGVDIEKIRPHTPDLLDYISSRIERNYIDKLPGAHYYNMITAIWVIKEAVMKALGSGLSLSPRRVVILGRCGVKYRVAANWQGRNSEWLVSTSYEDGYILAIAQQYHVIPHYWHYTTCISFPGNDRNAG